MFESREKRIIFSGNNNLPEKITVKTIGLLLTLAAALCVFPGCNDARNVKADKASVFLGGGQCALPGEKFAKPLYILLTAVPGNGLFSDPGNPPPASGRKVLFETVDGSDLRLSAKEAVSDEGGLAKIEVMAGRKTGDQYLRVIPADAPDKAITVRFITGIKITGTDQEGRAGTSLPEPLTVTVVSSEGKPVEGAPVYFTTMPGAAGAGANLSQKTVLTDAGGVARTEVRLGKKTGKYNFNIEVGATQSNATVRGIGVTELGVNVYTLFMNVFGGLAIFVFGMKLMSDGLHKAAGERMRSILHFFSSNRYVAVVAGTFVTAVIQSSSATTVMVIGFVNAGLLNLVQSIGIIFGANIGTTITAQIIAFDVSSIIMPAIILGLLLMFVTWKYLRGWGETVLGFGLLFFGMGIMSSELKLIGEFPSFTAFFGTFDCAPPPGGYMPFAALLGAIGIGMVMTMVIQSSSAATGIILALGASGLINLYTAIALVLGSNIGTTVTAQLAALTANRIAKQAALAHTLFNIFGVFVIGASFYIQWGDSGVPVFFYLVDKLTAGDAFAAIPQNLPRHIANAHTLFNVITTLLLLPFVATMAKVCEWVIPVRSEKVRIQYLEPHLLDTPSVALEQAGRFLRRMLKKSWKMVAIATEQHFIPDNVNEERFQSLAKKEEKIDRWQLEMTNYLVQLTRRELSEPQSQIIPLLLHCTNDAERIADHTENILSLTIRLNQAEARLSDSAIQDLNWIYGILKEQAKAVISTLDAHDPLKVELALKDGREMIRLSAELEAKHVERLATGECSAVTGVIYIELLAELEKVSSHLTNIAERSEAIQRNFLGISRLKNAAKQTANSLKGVQNPT